MVKFWRIKPEWIVRGLTSGQDYRGYKSTPRWQDIAIEPGYPSEEEALDSIERTFRLTGYWTRFETVKCWGWHLRLWRFDLTYSCERREEAAP